MSPPTASRRPAGFTLVELLVVISIIAILMALTTAAVQKVRDVGKRTTAVAEIRQIDMSLESFKSAMKVNEIACRGNGNVAPPLLLTNIGTFVLRSNYGASGSTTVPDYTQTFEHRFLKQLFPAAELGLDSTTFTNGLPNGTGNGVELDPSHLLTFWLGGYYGIVNASNTTLVTGVYGQGFNADSRFPFRFDVPAAQYPNGTPAAKKGPFYEFPTSRLALTSNTVPIGGECPRYVDPWGTPYCFFAMEGRPNFYPMRALPTPQVVHFDWNGSSIVPLKIYNPLQPTLVQYHNQKTHQVFSAGKDKLFPFAVGTNAPQPWTPGVVLTPFLESGKGGDDYSNFNPTIMSVQP